MLLMLFLFNNSEWYSWHFPELAKVVADHGLYAKLVKQIKNKGDLGEDKLDELEQVTQDAALAKQIVDAAKSSSKFRV